MGHSDLQHAGELIQNGDFGAGFAAFDRIVAQAMRDRDREVLAAIIALLEDATPGIRGRGQRDRAARIAATARRGLGGSTPALPNATVETAAAGLVERPVQPLAPVIEVLPATPLDSLPSKARTAIEEGLIPGESVMTVIRGTGSTAIVGTDRRAFIIKKGYLAGATFGQKLASFDYDNVVGVEVHAGALSGALVIHVPGASS